MDQDPSALSDDDRKRLSDAGMMPGQDASGSTGNAQPAAPSAPAAPSIPGVGTGAPATPKLPSYSDPSAIATVAPEQPSAFDPTSAPNLTGGGGFGGTPKQPAAPRQPDVDPALQSTGYTPSKSLVPGIPDFDGAHEAGLLTPQGNAPLPPRMRDTFGASQVDIATVPLGAAIGGMVTGTLGSHAVNATMEATHGRPADGTDFRRLGDVLALGELL